MDALSTFRWAFGECPIIAILRGLQPEDAEAIGSALFNAGIRIIEVPMNSPEPLDSIRLLARKFGSRALIGAGTVVEPGQVAAVKAAGGGIIVSPSVDVAVIRATVAAGLVAAPGYFTPSEAFTAIGAGANALKLFPAEGAPPAVLKAQRAVLPPDMPIIVVGGVTPTTMAGYHSAGADGFGIGSGLYRPGQTAVEVEALARTFVDALTSRT